VNKRPPYGCSVVVFRRVDSELYLLMLHRRHNGADYEGDWAWTAPSGARLPGETVRACARRELAEETGLTLPIHRTSCGRRDWRVFRAEAPHDTTITLDMEHDRYEWLTPAEALRRCLPARVRDDLACVIAQLTPYTHSV
jgi:8-oxo-dGTP pyrophosphatase MutT (NUDIX family)